ncbi:MAG: type VI secretion system tube protein Hcp [Aquincola sp.]|uniref:Hcp family type VI secretion system effector n=1 Tax=uncultured Aquincola sp. TaxID=886556 RepID=UPI0032B1841D|nr:type VI secretion system tube protein Hcp [Aquincola sp.]
MAKGDMHLRIEGKSTGVIRGESNVANHLGEIEVIEWSWGMSAASGLGGAGNASRAALSELRITKRVDTASTALMGVMRSNEQIKKAVLSVRKAGGMPIDYLVVTIERGRLTALDVATEAPDSPVLVERLSIAFEKIEVSYSGQDERGAKKASSSFTAEVTSA